MIWDTNTVIYYLKGVLPNADRYKHQPAFISIITEMELLGWPASDEEDLEPYHRFVNRASVYPLTTEIKNVTIAIRRLRKVKLPDAIIAATAIVHDQTLLSRNDKDFKGIKNLKYVNPFE